MNTAYIYSANRVNALATELLQPADVERLLEASSARDRWNALRESYLAPYLPAEEEYGIGTALDASVVAARSLLETIAPDPRLLQVLWYRNDLHNLRIFLKGRVRDMDYDAMAPYLSQAGVYAPEYLYEHVTQDTLYRLRPELHDAYHAAWRLAEGATFDAVDAVFDQAYFAVASQVAEETRDPFVREFVKMEIDLHNALLALRALAVPVLDGAKLFIPGGTFGFAQCATYEQAVQQLANYGGMAYWQSALTEYQENKNTTILDRLRDDLRLRFTTERAHDMFSVAALFAYALRVQQSAATVRTIMVGTETGVSDDVLRSQLRAY